MLTSALALRPSADGGPVVRACFADGGPGRRDEAPHHMAASWSPPPAPGAQPPSLGPSASAAAAAGQEPPPALPGAPSAELLRFRPPAPPACFGTAPRPPTPPALRWPASRAPPAA